MKNVLLPPSLFGVFRIKSWCNVDLTVDLASFFVLFVLIFRSVHDAFSIIQPLGEFK